MMTPAQLRDYAFTKAFKGYNADEVDAFLTEVAEAYETLYSENAVLTKKIDLLVEKIEQYRSEEDTLKCAIINAQKMGDSIMKDAQSRADIILRDAKIKSDKIVASCRTSVEEQKVEYDRLRKEISDFRGRLLDTYKHHLETIKELPSFEEAASAAEAAQEQTEQSAAAPAESQPAEALHEESAPQPAAGPAPAEESAVAEEKAEPEPAADMEATLEFDPVAGEREEKPKYDLDAIDTSGLDARPAEKTGESGISPSGDIRFGADYHFEDDDDDDCERPHRRGLFGRRK